MLCFLYNFGLAAQIQQHQPQRIQLVDGHDLHRFEFDACGPLPGRKVDVWLPKNTDINQGVTILFAHDGQNLFDPASSYGGESWLIHHAAQKLIDSGKIKPVIIVGIWNSPLRFTEYLPLPAFEGLSDSLKAKLTAERGGVPLSDAYLQWITAELKPLIEKHYKTQSNSSNTFILGSSMGGLISSYAMASYPNIFGGAGCLSTHWPISLRTNDKAYSAPYRAFLVKTLPQTGKHKLWMDYGTTTLDAWYEQHQLAFDAAIGQLPAWSSEHRYRSKKYPEAPHNETAWRERVGEVLLFLLNP